MPDRLIKGPSAPPAPLPRLILFSGLGLDPRFVADMQALDGACAQVEARPWLPPHQGETIPAYAQRMAAAIHPVDPCVPLYLAGPSFGGVVALEAARHLPCAGVLLVSSCTHGRALAWYVRLALHLAGRSPLWVMGVGLYLAPLAMCLFGRVDRRQRRRMLALWAACDRPQARWAARQLPTWKLSAPPRVPVWHLHGWIDHIIPRSGVHPTAWIPQGGHLINMTHPAQVNRFLADHLRQAPATPSACHPVPPSSFTAASERNTSPPPPAAP